ncbi:response regulator transcription factor [Chitinimonas sp.]|uniref:response regulator transcription factor n=1 Tax=Chitinimonas sp. TaxID=1934313 RepID=UPI002F942A9E
MNPAILVVEDDARLAGMLEEYLQEAGFQVTLAADGMTALARQGQLHFDLIVLDLMLPDLDGLEVCRRLRRQTDTPLLMLTARGDAMDRIIGLELGADDYLPKPFEPRELLARLRAILRRQRPSASGVADPTLRFGRLEIDPDSRSLRCNGVEQLLTGYQFDLLLALAAHPGRVQSRDMLLDQIKGQKLEAYDRSIDVHISRIRAAIEDNPKQPRRIITVRGAGYVFAKVQD